MGLKESALTKAVMREARQQLKVKQLRRKLAETDEARSVTLAENDQLRARIQALESLLSEAAQTDEDLAVALDTIRRQGRELANLRQRVQRGEELKAENLHLREELSATKEALRYVAEDRDDLRRRYE
jgi:hypothetical protein